MIATVICQNDDLIIIYEINLVIIALVDFVDIFSCKNENINIFVASVHNWQNGIKQAGAELCQAQTSLS